MEKQLIKKTKDGRDLVGTVDGIFFDGKIASSHVFRLASPMIVDGVTYVATLDKIALTADEAALAETLINAYLAPHHARRDERARKARQWDIVNNEGGEGYNPYR